MAAKDFITDSVVRCSAVGKKLLAQVGKGRFHDLDGVVGTLRACALCAGSDRHLFAALIGNVLCNLSNWPYEMADLVDWIGVPIVGKYFIPFANGGYCRKLRDNPNSTEGNLPHHMLSYFVMATYYFGDVISLGVAVHEIDTLKTQKSNPSGWADHRSGNLAVSMAQSMKGSLLNPFAQSVAGFADVYHAKCRMGPCGHLECRK